MGWCVPASDGPVVRYGAPTLLLFLCFLLRAKITSSLVTFIVALMLSVAFINVQQSLLADDDEEGAGDCAEKTNPNGPNGDCNKTLTINDAHEVPGAPPSKVYVATTRRAAQWNL